MALTAMTKLEMARYFFCNKTGTYQRQKTENHSKYLHVYRLTVLRHSGTLKVQIHSVQVLKIP